MRKVIVSEFVTLDGVMEDPGGADGFKYGGWSFDFGGADQQQFKFQELFEADAFCWAAGPMKGLPLPGRICLGPGNMGNA